MSEHHHFHPDFGDWLGAMRDGTINEQQFDELNKLLKTNAQARHYYIDYMQMAALLSHRSSIETVGIDEIETGSVELMAEVVEQQLKKQEQLKEDSARLRAIAEKQLRANTQAPDLPVKQEYQERERGVLFSLVGVNVYRSSRNNYGWQLHYNSVIAATFLAMACMIGYLWFFGNPQTPKIVQAPIPPRPIVAHLTNTLDAVWDQTILDDSPLRQGSLVLTSGMAEVKFKRGATVVLQAPCIFELDTDNTMRLQHGRLVANVPSGAEGFTVYTSNGRVTDFGTEFGVDTKPGEQTDVVVFQGEVEVAASLADPVFEPLRLTTNQTAKVDDIAHQATLEKINTSRFIRPDEFTAHVAIKNNRATKAQRRLVYLRQLKRNPSILAFAGFDPKDEIPSSTFGFDAQTNWQNIDGIDAIAPDTLQYPDLPTYQGLIETKNDRPVFARLDLSSDGNWARAGLINAQGMIGETGKTVYFRWLSQTDKVILDDSGESGGFGGFGGLSFMFGKQTANHEPLFVGRAATMAAYSIHSRNTLLDRQKVTAEIKVDLDVNPDQPGVQLKMSDTQVHCWLVKIEFRNGPDEISIWIDPQITDGQLPKPHAMVNDYDITFDRLRFNCGTTAGLWRFDEVLAGTKWEPLLLNDYNATIRQPQKGGEND